MPKSEVVRVTRRRQERRSPAVLLDAVEGQVVEICRDLAVQAKRMRQLQQQADELRVVIDEWVTSSAQAPDREPATRAGRR